MITSRAPLQSQLCIDLKVDIGSQQTLICFALLLFNLAAAAAAALLGDNID